MRILYVSSWFPVPADNGVRIRTLNLLQGLCRNHEVTLFSFIEPGTAAPPGEPSCCAAVATVPARHFDVHRLGSLFGLLHPTPRSLLAHYDPQMARLVEDHIAAGRCDVIIAATPRAAIHVPAGTPVPAIFEEVELGLFHDAFTAAPDAWQHFRHRLTWEKYRRYLRRLLRRFAACTVASENERALLRGIAPEQRIEVIANGLDLTRYGESYTPDPSSLIYAGALSYAPNRDAVDWFVRDIFPELRRRFPALRLTVTGDRAGHALAADGVVQSGWVADVRPLVGGAWASIVPLRTGGGTRVKVLESLALGTPVISTTKGVEGLAVVDGVHALIADDAASFAAAITRLRSDAELRAALAANGRALVRKHYDWQHIGARLDSLLGDVARPRSR